MCKGCKECKCTRGARDVRAGAKGARAGVRGMRAGVRGARAGMRAVQMRFMCPHNARSQKVETSIT